MVQHELRFQDKLVDSYKRCGGHATKWNAKFVAGPPDLICSLPGVGIHLIELKHVPKFGAEKPQIDNPMTKIQIKSNFEFLKAGGLTLLGVIGRSENAMGSTLFLFSPLKTALKETEAFQLNYEYGRGFDVSLLTRATIHAILGYDSQDGMK